ncbi:TraC family protein [Pelagibacterium sp. H642]|uniref:TraC family protein n=1 Tax=Pelagibacterium sp. H642 TaxID=1881069 RepID=UPI0028153360|nr:TraC family protein [Pelagibacterium sp. H642]WMT92935.1 TraC family protein [Pelagibacterium sp. H642]
MKKPSSRIREEIGRLQEQLKQAETREAERIGRLALKAGIGDVKANDSELVTAFEEVANRFCKGNVRPSRQTGAPVAVATSHGRAGEA